LPEALARSHHDSILSRPAPAPQRGWRANFARTMARRMMSRPARTIAGAALAAVMTGIIVNALLLQRSHRVAAVAPIAAPAAAAKSAAPAPAPEALSPSLAPAQAGGASAEVLPAPASVLPPARPADLTALIEATAALPRGADPIRELIRGDAGGKDNEARRLTIAAQSALIKLGFAVKADGVDGASTRQAIQQFERAHGTSSQGEITPKIVKQLAAAAAAR
jgi:hypothetical protein